MEEICMRGMHFYSESGNIVIFNGINLVCKEPEKGYLYPEMDKIFRAFKEKGFNLVRFGIFWDGVEPKPGQYDMEYLGKVKDAILLAEKYGLYILVDMHQDLYSRKYGDGAPEWATLDEGARHPEECTMWYDAYLQSDAIIQAADHFWENAPAGDGVGLLDHYGNMWQVIVQYLDDCTNIIGWEPMNEPFMGSLARKAFESASVRVRDEFPQFDWEHPEGASAREQELFMGYVTEQLQVFDRTTLMDFYRRMQEAIAPYSRKALVTGGNIYSSSDVPTGIEVLGGEGRQIYAPHGYDAVVDSDHYEGFSCENVERLFADKRDSQLRLGLPLIVGEWGGFPSKPFTKELIRHMNRILEKYLWGSAYWVYWQGLEADGNYDALSRVYPMETAGVLQSYCYEENEHIFTMTFEASGEGRTQVYCPFVPGNVTCDTGSGEQPVQYTWESIGKHAGYIMIKTEQMGMRHIIRVSMEGVGNNSER